MDRTPDRPTVPQNLPPRPRNSTRPRDEADPDSPRSPKRPREDGPIPDFSLPPDLLQPVHVEFVSLQLQPDNAEDTDDTEATEDFDPQLNRPFAIELDVTFNEGFRDLTEPPRNSPTIRIRSQSRFFEMIEMKGIEFLVTLGAPSQALREVNSRAFRMGNMRGDLVPGQNGMVDMLVTCEMLPSIDLLPGTLDDGVVYHPLAWNQSMVEIVGMIGPAVFAKNFFGPKLGKLDIDHEQHQEYVWFLQDHIWVLPNTLPVNVYEDEDKELSMSMEMKTNPNQSERSYVFEHGMETPNAAIDKNVLRRLHLFAGFISSEGGSSNILDVYMTPDSDYLMINWDMVAVNLHVTGHIAVEVFETPRSHYPPLHPYVYTTEVMQMLEFARRQINVIQLLSPEKVEVLNLEYDALAGDIVKTKLRVRFPVGFQDLFEGGPASRTLEFENRRQAFLNETNRYVFEQVGNLPRSRQLNAFVKDIPDHHPNFLLTRTIEIENEGALISLFGTRDNFAESTDASPHFVILFMAGSVASTCLTSWDNGSTCDAKFRPLLESIVRTVGLRRVLELEKRRIFDFDLSIQPNKDLQLTQPGMDPIVLQFNEDPPNNTIQPFGARHSGVQQFQYQTITNPESISLDNHSNAMIVLFVNMLRQQESDNDKILSVIPFKNKPTVMIDWDSCSVIVEEREDGFKHVWVVFSDPPFDQYPAYPKPAQIQSVLASLYEEIDTAHDRFTQGEIDQGVLRKIRRYRAMREEDKVQCRYTEYSPNRAVMVDGTQKWAGCTNQTDPSSLQELQGRMVFQTTTGTCFDADLNEEGVYHNTPELLRDEYHYHDPLMSNENWNMAGTEMTFDGAVLSSNCFDRVRRDDRAFLRSVVMAVPP